MFNLWRLNKNSSLSGPWLHVSEPWPLWVQFFLFLGIFIFEGFGNTPQAIPRNDQSGYWFLCRGYLTAARCFQNFRNIPQILTPIGIERSGARRSSRRGRGLRVLWYLTIVVGWSCRVPDMLLPRRGCRITLTRMSRRFMDDGLSLGATLTFGILARVSSLMCWNVLHISRLGYANQHWRAFQSFE